jgi:hypothetical protein
MAVRYPIAANAEQALNGPIGRAMREREAAALAGEAVAFVREPVGPEFKTREAAESAYAGLIDATGAPAVAPEDRYCELVELAARAGGKLPKGGQAEPAFQAGRRWPKPKRLLETVWRLSVGYWRPAGHPVEPKLPQARTARRTEEALDAAALRALARQPLKAVKPQQPLDIGLFEVRPPEAPHIVMPDE